jgi:hypothetical protein
MEHFDMQSWYFRSLTPHYERHQSSKAHAIADKCCHSPIHRLACTLNHGRSCERCTHLGCLLYTTRSQVLTHTILQEEDAIYHKLCLIHLWFSMSVLAFTQLFPSIAHFSVQTRRSLGQLPSDNRAVPRTRAMSLQHPSAAFPVVFISSATIKPYKPKTSANIKISTMPTKSLGCCAIPLTPASPTIPIEKPAAMPASPTERPAPS